MQRNSHDRILTNAKSAERRVARAWGSDRWVNDGTAHSDVRADCPVSVEVTRTKNRRIRNEKRVQAKVNAKSEGRPWVLVIAAPGDRVRDMDALVNHGWLLDVCRKAGVIPASGEPCLPEREAPTNPKRALAETVARTREMHRRYPFTKTVSSAAVRSAGEPCECGRPTSVCRGSCDFCTGGPDALREAA